MPGLDGPDLAPLLRAKLPELQIVMTTGDVSVEVAVRSLRAGVSDFIEKPLRSDSVLKATTHAMERRRLDRTEALYRTSQTIFDAQHFERLPEAIVSVSMQVMSR